MPEEELKTDGKPYDLRTRTKQFALRIVRLFGALPKTSAAQILGKQLLRSGTSVGANYREGRRGRSDAEVVSKLGIALQELEETNYWLELLAEGDIMSRNRLEALMTEADELTAILTTCVKKTKSRLR